MHRTEIAAFLNQKGGVGKTTSVINLGAGLVILGRKVLVVDLDPQAHLTTFLDIPQADIGKNIYDVLRGDADARDAIVTKPLRARLSIDGRDSQLAMSVIPSTLDLAEADMALSQTTGHELLLKKALATVVGAYDFVLFDCSPSLGLISTNALAAAHKVYVPIQTEYLALESLEKLLRRVEAVSAELNPELEIGGLIATRFDGRKVLSRTVVETLRENFGALLLNTMIRDNIVLAESPRFGKDIFSYRPRSFGAQDYLNLALEVMGRVTTADVLFSVERGVITSHADDNVFV